MGTAGKDINTIQIGEREIAQLGLGYLKAYYKFRPRVGESKTSIKVRGEGGVLADAYLEYLETETKTFTATLEATDYWHRDELRFRRMRKLLVLDAITGALALMAAVLSWFFFKGTISIFHLGPLSSIFTLLLIILAASGLITFFLWPFRRYRYIYAVEQFKSYHADDQWICFGWDVFPSYNNRYFRELRNQCIRYGFGLIEVERNSKIKAHLTPARNDVLGTQREQLKFSNISALPKVLGQSTTGFLKAPIQRDYFNWQKGLARFQRTYYNQVGVIVISLLLISGVIYMDYQNKPMEYVDEDQYEIQQNKLRASLEEEKNREVFYFKIDSGIFVRATDEYLTPFIVYDREQEPIPLVPPEKSMISIYQAGVFKDVPCDEFGAITQGRYMIFFASYYNQDEAKKIAVQLRKNNIAANVAWAECFYYAKSFYLVYLDGFFADLALTQTTVRRMAGELKENGLQYEVGFSQMSR